MKVLALALTLLLAACGAQLPKPRTVKQQRETAVSIFTFCPDEQGWGSGVLLDGRHVLTAAHVVHCGMPILRVETRAGDVRMMHPLKVDWENDLALIVIDDDELRFPYPVPGAVIGPRPPEGEVVCLESGRPDRARQCGEVLEYGRGAGNMAHRALTVPGNSGGGVYDESGRLVGIVTHWHRCGVMPCGGLASTLDEKRLENLLTGRVDTL